MGFGHGAEAYEAALPSGALQLVSLVVRVSVVHAATNKTAPVTRTASLRAMWTSFPRSPACLVRAQLERRVSWRPEDGDRPWRACHHDHYVVLRNDDGSGRSAQRADARNRPAEMSGRGVISIHLHESRSAARQKHARKTRPWQPAYRQHRPVVERKISHFSRPPGAVQGSLPRICPHLDGDPDPGQRHQSCPDRPPWSYQGYQRLGNGRARPHRKQHH